MSRKPQKTEMTKLTVRLAPSSKEDIKVIKGATGLIFDVDAVRYAIHMARKTVERGELY